MAKVSTKRKNTQQETFGAMSFPDIGDDTQDLKPNGNENDPKKGGKDDQDALLKSLQSQIEALTSKTNELQRVNLTLMAQSPGSGTGGGPRNAPKIDMTNLPDPTLDPEKYATEMASRVSAVVLAQQEQNQRVNQDRNNKENRVKALWDDFATAHEDYADPDKVDFIAQKVVRGMQARGIDLEKYMFGAKETFFNDVVQEYEKVFGKPNDEPDDTRDDNDDQGATRTAGIFGGFESAGRTTSSDGPQSDMIAEIQAVQRKKGFY